MRSPNETEKFPVILEVRPRIQACNVFLKTPASGATVQMAVNPLSLSIEWTLKNVHLLSQSVILPSDLNFKLRPQNFSPLVVQDDASIFRIETEPGSSLAGSFSTEVLLLQKSRSENVCFKQDIPVNNPCILHCVSCGADVLNVEFLCFNRVLPLPSSQFDADDLFCHKHNNEAEHENCDVGFSLNPKRLDCFYGTCFIQIHSSYIETDQSVVKCSQCSNWLGTRQKDSVRLWNCCVVLSPVNSSVKPNATMASYDFLAVIEESIQNSFSVTCRVLLEAKVSEQTEIYLMLWIVDKELLLLTQSDSSQTLLHAHTTRKVAFCYEEKNNDLVKQWLNDSNVVAVETALPIIKQGLRILSKTSELIPALSRQAQNGFLFGYISKYFIDSNLF